MSASEVKELRLTMRLSNNRIRVRREQMGLSGVAAAAKAGVSYGTWCAYESLRKTPYGKLPGFGERVGWKPVPLAMARALNVTCEYLWPESVLDVVQPAVVQEIDAMDLRPQLVAAQVVPALPSAEDHMVDLESSDSVRAALNTLSLREQRILRQRFGFDDEPLTTQEVAAELGLSRSRVDQIESRAFEKLRRCFAKGQRP